MFELPQALPLGAVLIFAVYRLIVRVRVWLDKRDLESFDLNMKNQNIYEMPDPDYRNQVGRNDRSANKE